MNTSTVTGVKGANAEFVFSNLLNKERKVKRVSFDTIAMYQVAKKFIHGKNKLKASYSTLLERYGTNETINSTYKTHKGLVKSCTKQELKLDYNNVPSTVFADLVLGVDFFVMFKGYTIAIDVTTGTNYLHKMQKNYLQLPIVQSLGCDYMVTLALPKNVGTKVLKQSLEDLLNSVIRNDMKIQLHEWF